MQKNHRGAHVTPKAAPVPEGARALMSDPQAAGRLTVAHTLPMIAFPAIGCLLFILGKMPVSDIFFFLAGSGGIGAAVTIVVTGGRRAAVAIAHGVLAAATSR
ncbi:hypothetical protein LUR56_37750 [Streptomyces sp. MT29]|nr:hypothetical protein [Streptomyces sp. MT29]